MKNSLHVEIYLRSKMIPSIQQGWANAVGYLYSKYLGEQKVTTPNFTKIAVMLGDREEEWDGDTKNRVAMLYQAFSPSLISLRDVEKFQIAVLDGMCLALRKLKGVDTLSVDLIEKCRLYLLNDGFVQVTPISKVADKKKLKISLNYQIRLRLMTGAQAYQYVLELTNLTSGHCLIQPLLLIKPSWLLAYANLKDWSLKNDKTTLLLVLKHPKNIDAPYESYLESSDFGSSYYDAQKCDLPWTREVDESEVKYEFDITTLIENQTI